MTQTLRTAAVLLAGGSGKRVGAEINKVLLPLAGVPLIVTDYETAELADLYLPLLPGTDVALFHGMLHVMFPEVQVCNPFCSPEEAGISVVALPSV